MLPSPLFGPSDAVPVVSEVSRAGSSKWLMPRADRPVDREIHRCDVCNLNFYSRPQLDIHVEEHIPCGFADCQFEGNYRMVLDHETSLHMNLRGGQNKVASQQKAGDGRLELRQEALEDIAKWKEERKKRFPKLLASSLAERGEDSATVPSALTGRAPAEKGHEAKSGKSFVAGMTALPKTGIAAKRQIGRQNGSQRRGFNGREKRSQGSKGRVDAVRHDGDPRPGPTRRPTLFQKLMLKDASQALEKSERNKNGVSE